MSFIQKIQSIHITQQLKDLSKIALMISAMMMLSDVISIFPKALSNPISLPFALYYNGVITAYGQLFPSIIMVYVAYRIGGPSVVIPTIVIAVANLDSRIGFLLSILYGMVAGYISIMYDKYIKPSNESVETASKYLFKPSITVILTVVVIYILGVYVVGSAIKAMFVSLQSFMQMGAEHAVIAAIAAVGHTFGHGGLMFQQALQFANGMMNSKPYIFAAYQSGIIAVSLGALIAFYINKQYFPKGHSVLLTFVTLVSGIIASPSAYLFFLVRNPIIFGVPAAISTFVTIYLTGQFTSSETALASGRPAFGVLSVVTYSGNLPINIAIILLGAVILAALYTVGLRKLCSKGDSSAN